MLGRLADLVVRRARLVLVGAAVLAVTAAVIGSSAFDALQPFGFDDQDSEAVVAREGLEHALGVEPVASVVVLARGEHSVLSVDGRARLARISEALSASPEIGAVRGPSDPGGGAQVSGDRRSAYVLGFFRAGLADDVQEDAARELEDTIGDLPGTAVGGLVPSNVQFARQIESDFARAELLALPLIFLLAVVFFRGAAAALLPLGLGGLSIVGSLAALRIGQEMTDLSIFAVNLVTALGLGLAIDYSLLVVSRYREELARDGDPASALRKTLLTAGRTVVFSSITIAAAMASLLLFPQRFLYSMGVGGVSVSLMSAAAALTVLPALILLLGTRIDAFDPVGRRRTSVDGGRWHRLTRFAMRHRFPVLATTGAALVLVSLPLLGIRFVAPDARLLPESAGARQVEDALRADFEATRMTPAFVHLRAGVSGERFARRVARLPGVADVDGPVPAGRGSSRVDVIPGDANFFSTDNERLVERIRALAPPSAVVGGAAADFVDRKASLRAHFPAAAAIVIVTSLAALFLLTGSGVLPFKALFFNAATIAASFGLLVLIFQEGSLGFEPEGGIDMTLPILNFAVVFGLSTDYTVFVLSRIREERDRGLPDAESAALGIARSGRVISMAALLFAVAVGALLVSKIVFIREFGLVNAVAVLIDAFVIRALLLPSSMAVLGRFNWWAPVWLRRVSRRADAPG